jgi:hypothetical protein
VTPQEDAEIATRRAMVGVPNQWKALQDLSALVDGLTTLNALTGLSTAM